MHANSCEKEAMHGGTGIKVLIMHGTAYAALCYSKTMQMRYVQVHTEAGLSLSRCCETQRKLPSSVNVAYLGSNTLPNVFRQGNTKAAASTSFQPYFRIL